MSTLRCEKCGLLPWASDELEATKDLLAALKAWLLYAGFPDPYTMTTEESRKRATDLEEIQRLIGRGVHLEDFARVAIARYEGR